MVAGGVVAAAAEALNIPVTNTLKLFLPLLTYLYELWHYFDAAICITPFVPENALGRPLVKVKDKFGF